ncbi:MAG: hypothetical protein R3C01_06295 [Planctomycetaceae bacterium]
MPRLFWGNFDFETTLGFVASTAVSPRLLGELAFSWLAIAGPEDVIVTPMPPRPDELQQLSDSLKTLLPRFVSHPEELSQSEGFNLQDFLATPWGWSAFAENEFARWGVTIPDHPAPAIVRMANSRQFSSSQEQSLDCALRGSMTLQSFADVDGFLSQEGELGLERRWVIKADLSNSARERLLGQGETLTDSQRRWIAKRLERDGRLHAEPWVERIAEAGVQWEIPQSGEPQLIGVVPLLTATNGEYRGSLIAAPDDETFTNDALHLDTWRPAIDCQRQVVERLQQLGYFGPCGIDACWYLSLNGEQRLRPIQDINARWTMGRLALGWRHRLPPQTTALWHFGPDSPAVGDPADHISLLRTTPTTLVATPLRLPSQLQLNVGNITSRYRSD